MPTASTPLYRPPFPDRSNAYFGWAPFRATKAAVKLHTLLDLRGSLPAFIHVSDGKLHDVRALDLIVPEPGAIYVMDRAYVDFRSNSESRIIPSSVA